MQMFPFLSGLWVLRNPEDFLFSLKTLQFQQLLVDLQCLCVCMCMRMYLCIHIYICICIHTYMYTYKYIYSGMYLQWKEAQDWAERQSLSKKIGFKFKVLAKAHADQEVVTVEETHPALHWDKRKGVMRSRHHPSKASIFKMKIYLKGKRLNWECAGNASC